VYASSADLQSATAAQIPAAFGDVDCSGSINVVDSLKILRFSVGLPQPQGVGPCRIGDAVLVDSEPRLWGDNDCSGTVNSIDALKTLRQLTGLSYVQNEPCSDIGSAVQVDFGQ
jgi:hypothetical protein